MYPPSFEYYRASTVAEAIELLKNNDGAKVLAGGHSLLPAMKLRVSQPTALVDIGRITELSGIAVDGGALKIGALTTHTAVADSAEVKKHCALLAETAAYIGDQQVRNRGTLGGSLAHSDPAADYPTAILALGATIHAYGPSGVRAIAAGDFFKDLFTTALNSDEILVAISFPAYGSGTGGAYVKHANPASGYAVVGVAALVSVSGGKITKASVAIGGLTSNPYRASAVEAALGGTDEASVAAAAAKATDGVDVTMSDHYASADYRKHLAMVLTKRAVLAAIGRA